MKIAKQILLTGRFVLNSLIFHPVSNFCYIPEAISLLDTVTQLTYFSLNVLVSKGYLFIEFIFYQLSLFEFRQHVREIQSWSAKFRILCKFEDL